jgi:hypothetical protein
MLWKLSVALLAVVPPALLAACGGSTTTIDKPVDGGSPFDASTTTPPGPDGSSVVADGSTTPMDAGVDSSPPLPEAQAPLPDAGETCAAAGGTCGYFMAGFCPNGNLTSNGCGGASNTLCCLPGSGPNSQPNPCVNAGGLCLASCISGWAPQTNFSCSDALTCCFELGGGP